MAQLLDLPIETLHEIVEYSATDAWQHLSQLSQLKALCLTCRALCSVAQPILFQTFAIGLEKYWHGPKTGSRYLKFADTVARRPDLRKSVKILELCVQNSGYLTERGESWILPGFDLGGLRTAAPQYFSSKKKREVWAVRQPLQVFPHVEVLLSILPRLQVLKLKVFRTGQTEPYLGLGPESAQYLANLKEMELINPGDLRNEAEFGPIMPLLVSLPQLKKLKLENFDIAGSFKKRKEREAAQWHVAESTLPIEDLCIGNCSMTNEILQRIVRSCQRLTHFNYTAWQDIDYEKRRHFWRPELDVEGLHAALSLHKDSLQELSLDFVNQFEKQDEIHPADMLPPHPSFQSFPYIKTLRIEYRRMRYENLAPNLTYLYLYDCRGLKYDDRGNIDNAEVEAWKAIKKNFCYDIEKFEIMCTDACRGRQRQLKYMHFDWGSWDEKTREWEKDGFLLKVWFMDFIDGTYHFSQGTDDTGDIDSNGEKIKHEDWDDYEDDYEDEDDDESESQSKEDASDDDESVEGSPKDDNEISNGDNNEERKQVDQDEPKVADTSSPSNTTLENEANSHTSLTLDWVPTNEYNGPRGLDDPSSSHTFDWVDELMSDFDEMDIDINDAQSRQTHDTFDWVDEMISEAEDENEEIDWPNVPNMRAILLADEDLDDGWRGGEWMAPYPVGASSKESGKKD